MNSRAGQTVFFLAGSPFHAWQAVSITLEAAIVDATLKRLFSQTSEIALEAIN